MLASRLKINNPWLLLALLCIGYAVSFFHRVAPAVLTMDLMRDFSLDAASLSLVSSATILGYAITQVPSGIITDMIGGRRTLAVYQVAAGVFSILFTLSDSLSSAVACRFLLGLTLASNVPSYKVLAYCFPASQYAKVSSFLTVCGSLGSLMAGAPLAAMTGLTGWRAALLIAGLFTLFLGAVIWLCLHDYERGDSPPSPKESLLALKSGLQVVVRMRNFWLIFAWFFFMVGNLFTLLTCWWGGYLLQGCGLSRDDAGLVLSIMAIGPLPLIMLFPFLSDNVFHSRRVLLLGAALVECIILAILCFNKSEPFSLPVLAAFGLILNVATTCIVPLAFTMVKESVPLEVMASAFGILNCSGPVLSAVLQGIFGSVLAWRIAAGSTELAAYADAFWLMLVNSTMALLACLFMKDTLRVKS